METRGQFTSTLEQAEEGFVRVAKIIERYHEALRADTALSDVMIERLTIAFQAHLLESMLPHPKNKDGK